MHGQNMKHQNFIIKPGRHRWKDDNMNFKEAEQKGVVDWIHLAHDTLLQDIRSFLLLFNLQCRYLRLF
jgi:hypothetical protein